MKNIEFEQKTTKNNLNLNKPALMKLFENDLKDLTSNIVSKNKSFINVNLNNKNAEFETEIKNK